MVADQVEEHVVAVPGRGEVLPGVIEDTVRAERPDQAGIPGAADAGDLSAERLGDLDGERSHAPGCSVDQHLVTRPDLPLVPQTLKRGQGSHRNSSRLPGGDVAWQGGCGPLGDARILIEGHLAVL